MQYPRLVPPKLCTAEVRVVFLGGVDIEGREAVLATYCGRCNLRQKTKQVLTADKRLVTLEAAALFDGDIAPYLPQPKGLLYLRELHALDCENGETLEAEKMKLPTLDCEHGECLETERAQPIFTEDKNGVGFDLVAPQPITFSAESTQYRIFRFTKERNPDGTVNYTRLELTR